MKKQAKKPKSPIVIHIPLDQITGGLAPQEQKLKRTNERDIK